jgi:hypothetical protein
MWCTQVYRWYKVLYTHTDGTHIHDSCVQRTVISCFTFYLFVYILDAYRGTKYLYRIYVLPGMSVCDTPVLQYL